MAVQALRPFTRRRPRCEFVSNIDGCQLAECWRPPIRETTLFIVCSKTFTTLETLTNARSARARGWSASWASGAVPEHFAAVSVNHQAMDEFGVHPEYRFQMWDWVGGRYSLWSSIGVSLAIAVGRRELHGVPAWRRTKWTSTSARHRGAQNLPALMALMGVWNINFCRPADARGAALR